MPMLTFFYDRAGDLFAVLGEPEIARRVEDDKYTVSVKYPVLWQGQHDESRIAMTPSGRDSKAEKGEL